MRPILLAPALLALGIVGGLTLVSGGLANMTSAEQVAQQYANAIIANDINTVGRLGGMSTGKGSPLEQLWGKAYEPIADALAQSKAYNPKDYKIQVKTLSKTATTAKIQMNVFAKDIDAIMDRVQLLMGYQLTADGRVIPPENDEFLMSFSEALKKVESEKEVPFFHYRVPLQFYQERGQWFVKYDKNASALISLLRLTNLSREHEVYLVKP